MDEVLFLDTPVSLGQKVKIMRVVRLLTQVELADFAGVTQTEVSAFERNQPVRPNARQRILKTFGMDREVPSSLSEM